MELVEKMRLLEAYVKTEVELLKTKVELLKTKDKLKTAKAAHVIKIKELQAHRRTQTKF